MKKQKIYDLFKKDPHFLRHTTILTMEIQSAADTNGEDERLGL